MQILGLTLRRFVGAAALFVFVISACQRRRKNTPLAGVKVHHSGSVASVDELLSLA